MLHAFAVVARVIGGIFLAGFGVALIYWFCVFGGGWWWLLKVPILPFVLVVGVLAVDSGLGIATRGNDTPQTVTFVGTDSNKTVFIVAPGYNGTRWTGAALAHHLTPYGTVVTVQPSLKGYDMAKTADALWNQVKRLGLQDKQIVAEGESIGGHALLELLRRHPEAHFDTLVLNAMPFSAAQVRFNQRLLRIAGRLPGGPITTLGLRINQRWFEYPKSPKAEAGASPKISAFADRQGLLVTAPMALRQLRAMVDFVPPGPYEFGGRIGKVIYVHAPGDRDDLVETQASYNMLKGALNPVPVDDYAVPTWASGAHCPTPSHPRGLAQVMVDASSK